MKISALVTSLFLSATALHAADPGPATLLATRGTLLYSDDLQQAPDGKAWRAPKGQWEVKDGALRGAEIAEDKHGAVTRHPLAFGDAVIQFDVKLDGCRGTSLSINDAKEHLARVSLNPKGFTVQKDDHDHAGPDQRVLFGKRDVELKTGEWHTVVVEFVGTTMLVTVDGAHATFGDDALIAAAKANLGFTVAGQSAAFRNLRVWAATPNADWAKTKATLAATK